MPKGFIKLEREIWEDELFNDGKPLSRREAWIWLLCHVDYKTNEIAVSQRELAKVWGWKLTRTHDFINKLIEKGYLKRSEHNPEHIKRTENEHAKTYYSINYNDNKNERRTGKANGIPNNARVPIFNIKNNKETSSRARANESEMFEEAMSDTEYKKNVCEAFNITPSTFEERMAKFRDECAAKKKRHTDAADYQTHFFDWMKKQPVKAKKDDSDNEKYEQFVEEAQKLCPTWAGKIKEAGKRFFAQVRATATDENDIKQVFEEMEKKGVTGRAIDAFRKEYEEMITLRNFINNKEVKE